MNDIQKRLEKLDKLHSTKKDYLFGIICQCLTITMMIVSVVFGIIEKNHLILTIISFLFGIVIFCLIDTITKYINIKKEIIKETDDFCDILHEENKKFLIGIISQVDKELENLFKVSKEAKDKAEADKKAEAKKKEPTKKAKTTKSIQKKADPKKVAKKDTKKS